MRKELALLWMLAGPMAAATAQVSIDINLQVFPQLVPMPGYPVYYAPGVNSNYFFYDGMYWLYQDDNWYASSWYNGPWDNVGPEYVPLYILRIPVRYYRRAPDYFRSWQPDQPPHWGEHWGNGWSQRRQGWDHWNRHSAPSRAPLPVYQQKYAGDRYPQADQQRGLQRQNSRYAPHDPQVRQQMQNAQSRHPAPAVRQDIPQQDRQHGNQPPPGQQVMPPQTHERKPQSNPPQERPQQQDHPQQSRSQQQDHPQQARPQQQDHPQNRETPRQAEPSQRPEQGHDNARPEQRGREREQGQGGDEQQDHSH